MAEQKKKSRKFDRNRKWCQAYRLSSRREINAIKKQARKCARNIVPAHPNNPQFDGAIARLERLIKLHGPTIARTATRELSRENHDAAHELMYTRLPRKAA